MSSSHETATVPSVPILLNNLLYERPELPQEFVKLLRDLREAIMAGDADNTWESGAEAVLRMYHTRWFEWQKRDYLERRKDGMLCENITGCMFFVVSGLFYTGALPHKAPVNLHRLQGSVYGREVICRPNGAAVIEGWSNELSLENLKDMLFYIDKRWFSYTYGHHEVIAELFPTLLQRLCELFEEDDPEDEEEAADREEMLWTCEAYLRCLSWPMTVRSHFETIPLADVPNYDEEMYLVILGAVEAWVEDTMVDQNARTMAWFRQDVLEDWILPCIREIASRTLGTPRSMISANVIKKYMPVDLRMQFLEDIKNNSNQEAVYRSPPSQTRQGLIMVNVIESAKAQFDYPMEIAVKNLRNLRNIKDIEDIVSSTHTYLLEIAGSYMAVWNGYSFISRRIEEAIAQMLYLEHNNNMMKTTLLAMDLPPSEDPSSAHLTKLHKQMMAIEA